MTSLRLVCAGLATVDLVYRVDRIPGVDEKAEATGVEIAAGGPATNAAVAASALGASVTLVTAIGAHPLGGLIRADLAERGVHLLDAAPHATEPPPVSAITVLNGTGQRTVVGRNAAGAAVDVPDGLDEVLAAADAVLVDGHHPALAAAAARAGRPLVVDAGSWRPVFAEVLPHATVAACSAAFRHPAAASLPPGSPPTGVAAGSAPGAPANIATGTAAGDAATAAAVLAAGARHVAITHGPDPIAWWSPGGSGTVAVPAVDAVDTAAAGDVFHGALAMAVARDPAVADLPGALSYAAAVAAIRVTHRGPRAWLADPRLPTLPALPTLPPRS